jgi:hypothetical protein
MKSIGMILFEFFESQNSAGAMRGSRLRRNIGSVGHN